MERTLRFHLVKELPQEFIVPPVPSSKLRPQLFKNITGYGKDNIQTVKKCIPFVDAMTMGYTVLLHIDLIIKRDFDNKITLKYLSDSHKKLLDILKPIEVHPKTQVPNAPFEDLPIVKFMNPWRVETPPNYSTLYLPPANRFDLPVMPLVGLVDTDRYKNVVNFPFVIPSLLPNSEVLLEKGTPIVQIIPIKRDNWKEKTTLYNQKVLKETKQQREDMTNDREDYYRRKLWKRKVYN